MNADDVAFLIVHDRPSNLVGKRPRRESPRPRGNNRFESGAKPMPLNNRYRPRHREPLWLANS